MLITRETDYALRILRTLSQGGCITVGRLSEEEMLPQKFAYKILKKLEKAGIVRMMRGAGGGCILECDLKLTSFYDLVTAVENKAFLSVCMTPGYECEWRGKHGKSCTVHEQLFKLQTKLDDEFSSVSLYQIITGEDDPQK